MEVLAGYVPPVVVRRIAEENGPIPTPSTETLDGSCLFVDIAGFTPLTERLSKRGTVGAETMAGLLDRYFGRFIDLADRHGGEILDFAGDALLAAWWADTSSIHDATLSAIGYATALQSVVEDEPALDGIRLSAKVTIATGSMKLVYVGGIGGRKHLVVAGDPISRLGRLGSLVEPGQIVLDASAAKMVEATIRGIPVTAGAVRLERLVSPIAPTPSTPPPALDAERPAIREFVAAAVPDRLDSGLDEWSADFRRVSSVFVNLIGADLGSGKDADRVNTVTCSIQQVVQRYDGAIHQFIEDDKGTVMLIGFGLPPRSHEDDPARAVMAALDIEAAVADNGLRSGIGVATGTAFCGPVGTARRREFTVLGDSVNLAARLMQAAPDDILCDATTARAFDRIEYDELAPFSMKGKREPVPAFRPQGDLPKVIRSRAERIPIVGRHRERQTLIDALGHAGEDGATVVIEGEAGIGKSRLVEFFIDQAQRAGVTVMAGTGSAIEASTPYFPWQPILREALGLTGAPPNPGAQRRHVLRMLRQEPDLLDSAPMLNDVLGLRLPGNPNLDGLTSQERAARTRRLLFRILERAVEADPTAIVLEDAQWMDLSSWQLATRIADELAAVLVIAARPPGEDRRDDFTHIAQRGQHLRLGKLSEVETAELTARNLGVDRLPAEARDFIIARAEGHPFFAEELAYAVRDSGLLTGGRFAADADALEALHLPDTVQGVVKSRLDQLAESHRLVLKIAAVAGRSFDAALIIAVHPVGSDAQQIPDYLDGLEHAGLITGESDGIYRFRHAITRDVTYESLLHGQRRSLHRSIAMELERRGATHAVLAHHWLQAASSNDDPEATARAEHHLYAAGQAALRVGAFTDADRFLRDALACFQRLDEPDPDRELAILRPLGTATFATRGYGAAATREVYERAFALADGRLAERDLFPILWGLWITTHFAFDAERAVALGEELLRIADRVDDDELRLQAHHALWTTLIVIPDYERARRHLELGSKLYRAKWHGRHCAEFGGHDPGSCARRAQALVGWSTGQPDRAVRDGEEAVRLAQNHSFSRLNAMLALAFVHRQRGDLAAAERQVDLLVDTAMQAGFPGMANWARMIGGWVEGRRRDVAGGIATIEAAAEKLGMKDPGYMAMLVELYLADGRIEDGLRLVGELFDIVERRGEHSYEPELYRLQGELLASKGQREEALRCLREALAISRRQGAWSFALRAATSLVKAGIEDALGDLRQISEGFTEGFETMDLTEARALLTAAGKRP